MKPLACYNSGSAHKGWEPEADYVVTDADGVRRAVCGNCAGNAVESRRWVHVTPIEAVGEEVMRQLRESRQEHRIEGAAT